MRLDNMAAEGQLKIVDLLWIQKRTPLNFHNSINGGAIINLKVRLVEYGPRVNLNVVNKLINFC